MMAKTVRLRQKGVTSAIPYEFGRRNSSIWFLFSVAEYIDTVETGYKTPFCPIIYLMLHFLTELAKKVRPRLRDSGAV